MIGSTLVGYGSRLARMVRTHPRPARHVAALLLTRTGLSSLIRIPLDGIRLWFYPTAMSTALWENPHVYDADLAFYRRYLRSGDTVVDVGANIGLVALTTAKLVGAQGRVIAVEAHPRLFAYLQGNLTLNGMNHVSTVNAAAGETTGTIGFSDLDGDDSQNGVSLAGGRLEVPLAPLDSVVRVDGPIALLKMDVEGYELFALRGARETLARTSCVYFESWAAHFAKFGYRCADVRAELARSGFTVYRVVDEARLVEVPADDEHPACENLVATRDPAALCARTGYVMGAPAPESASAGRDAARA